MSEIIDLTTGNFGYGFSDDYKQGYSDGRASIVSELESLKTEIGGSCIFSISKIDVLDIIDKRISELKGEQE